MRERERKVSKKEGAKEMDGRKESERKVSKNE